LKLLFDENLSRRLPLRVADLFPDSVHVSQPGLLETPDPLVWRYARENGFAILTADRDFYELAISHGHPPKVIYIERCDFGTAAVESLIRKQAIRIADFLFNKDTAVLILRRK